MEEVKLPSYLTSLLAVIGSFIGGLLVSKGYFTAEQLPQLGGAALAVVIAVWRLYAKSVHRAALAAAVAAPAGRAT